MGIICHISILQSVACSIHKCLEIDIMNKNGKKMAAILKFKMATAIMLKKNATNGFCVLWYVFYPMKKKINLEPILHQGPIICHNRLHYNAGRIRCRHANYRQK